MRPLKPFLLTPLILCTFDPSTSSAATVQGSYGVSTTGYVIAETISATTIKTTAPTASDDAATKAYVDATVAAAGGGRLKYMGVTSTTYTGNLGGILGANTKCAANYLGSRMMQSSEFAKADYTNTSPTTAGWIHCDQVFGVSTAYYCATAVIGAIGDAQMNCNNWSSSTSGSYGGPIAYSGIVGNPGSPGCARTYPIHCVKD